MFVQNGKMIMPARDRGNEIPLIPVGVYVVKFDRDIGFFLQAHDGMGLPEKTYGDTGTRADMVIKTYLSRKDKNTGVLLSGNKGSGKTLLAKVIAAKAMELEMPVILIETAFGGVEFNQFMNSITQQCVIFIDEFEKKYEKKEEQNMLLSLLDGTGVTNKMFMLTSNSASISEFLISRPSRIFYHWTYGKMDEQVLLGYCEENLNDKIHVDNMRTLWNISTDMSFDVMQAIVEELNRYPDLSFVDALCNMNISLGDALSRLYVNKAIKWGDTEFRLSETRAQVNLVEFQSGATSLRANARCEDWMFQVAMTESENIRPTDWYSYNYNLFSQVEKEQLTHEQIQKDRMFSEDITLQFKFDHTTDSLDADEITFTRMVGGKPLIVTFESAGAESVNAYFRRLFK